MNNYFAFQKKKISETNALFSIFVNLWLKAAGFLHLLLYSIRCNIIYVASHWKIQLYICERMSVKKANNLFKLL